MEPVKVPSPEYYKKVVLGLGDKVYSREELESRIQEIDREVGFESKRHATHVTKTMSGIKNLAEDYVIIMKDDTKKSSSDAFYQITEPLKVVGKIMKAGKPEKTTEKLAPKAASTVEEKKKKEEKPMLVSLEGRKLKKIELPSVKVVDSAEKWTNDEHELAFLVGGLLKKQGKGLGEGQILKVLRTDCGIATTDEDLRSLIKREPNLEYDSRSGVVVRLVKDEKGSSFAAWENIKNSHDPSKIRKTLIIRTGLSKEDLTASLPGAKVFVLSDEKMVGTLYHVEVSASENDLIRVVILYDRLQGRSEEFMYAPTDDKYMHRVKNAWGRIERSLRETSVRFEIEEETWLE